MSYIAPEILKGANYGKAVDMWYADSHLSTRAEVLKADTGVWV
jgi:serine/threonine protein kinase